MYLTHVPSTYLDPLNKHNVKIATFHKQLSSTSMSHTYSENDINLCHPHIRSEKLILKPTTVSNSKDIITPCDENKKISSNIITNPKQCSVIKYDISTIENNVNHSKSQFVGTSSDSSINLTMSISATVRSYFTDRDIDNIHSDLARTMCKHIGALSFILFYDWLRYDTIGIDTKKQLQH